MNQTTIILDWLKRGHRITSFQAFSMFGVTRLSAKIFEIKKAGYNIQWNIIEKTNQFGNKVRYKEYFLVEKEKNNE